MPTTPDCECHSEPMFWHKDSRVKGGGTWVCFTRKREDWLKSATKSALTKGQIPLAPVLRAVENWVNSVGWEHEPNPYDPDAVKPLAPIRRLEGWTGQSDLYWLRKKKKWIDFDIADRIITTLNVWLWHSDPELRRVYQEANLAGLDRRRPTDRKAA